MPGCQKPPPYETGVWAMPKGPVLLCIAEAETIWAEDICCIDWSAFSLWAWSKYEAGLPLFGTWNFKQWGITVWLRREKDFEALMREHRRLHFQMWMLHSKTHLVVLIKVTPKWFQCKKKALENYNFGIIWVLVAHFKSNRYIDTSDDSTFEKLWPIWWFMAKK